MNEYIFSADFLSKFHMAPHWIQAFWIFSGAFVLSSGFWLVKEITVSYIKRDTYLPRGQLCYTVYQGLNNQLIVVSHGETFEANIAHNVVILPRDGLAEMVAHTLGTPPSSIQKTESRQ